MSIFRRNHDLDDRVVEALLSGRTPSERPELGALAGLMREARATVPAEPPAASRRLEAMFDKGVVPVVVPLRTGPLIAPTKRRTTFGATAGRAVLVGAAAVAAVLTAAAANTLPAPAQTAVANVVEALTPLTIPRPAAPATPTKDTVRPTAPKVGPVRPVAPRPKPQSSAVPATGPSASPKLVGPDVVILPAPSDEPTPDVAPEPAPSDDPDASPSP